MGKDWYIVCLMHNFILRLDGFPFSVGREPPEGGHRLAIDEPFISRLQFVLERRADGRLWYVNRSRTNPALIDGKPLLELQLTSRDVHLVTIGDLVVGFGTDAPAVFQAVADASPDLYGVSYRGREFGPLLFEHLVEACTKRVFDETATTWLLRDPDQVYNLFELAKRTKPASAAQWLSAV